MKRQITPALAAAPTLQALLDMPDDALERRLIRFIRQSGLKFRSRENFNKIGWREGPDPIFAKFWKREGAKLMPSLDPMIWDLRAPLLQDEALSCCCVLLWRRSRRFNAQWIGGVESAAIPVIAGILAVNRAAGAAPLNGFYIRKQRKSDGLRRLLEGVPPPRGTRVLLVDDILNKGISKRQLVSYCDHNNLKPAALLVVVDAQNKGHELFAPVCPVEALFTRRVVLGSLPCDVSGPTDLATRVEAPLNQASGVTVDARPGPGSRRTSPGTEMNPEDVELVRLARDAVLFAALSGGKRRPTLGEDNRGSAGYLPFLGRYLRERGPVFTRISKRELRGGTWFNRLRGCQAAGLFDPEPGTIAEMTIKSARLSATRARKVRPGPASFHKPVWPEEIGDLSLFVYVVEQFVPTNARTVDELLSEGHEVKGWGLVAQGQGYRGVVCGDLDDVPDVARQVAVACRKMQNSEEIRPRDADKVTFTRMKGHWLWDPARPKAAFF
jgi:orotate phosphoribosyltransferase